MNRTILHITFLSVVLVFFACGGKEIASTPERPQPAWVNSRPINPSYYVGIGSVSKAAEPLDYASVAKKNALSDLASEIKVTVKSESFLNTMQVNMQVQEEFNSSIATFTDEEIEGFELIDSWENGADYFVYYRLSKAYHEQLRLEKKQAVMSSAYDQLSQARVAKTQGDIAGATDLYFRALFEMKEYWSEVNQFNDGGQIIYLDNTIYAELREMINQIELRTSPDVIRLDASNQFKADVRIGLFYQDLPVRGGLLLYRFDNGKYRKANEIRTDVSGEALISIMNADLTNPSNALELTYTVNDLIPKDLDSKLVSPLVEGLRPPSLVVPIRATLPSVMFMVEEKNLGAQQGTERLATPLRGKMAARGFRFTEQTSEADFQVIIKADTRAGGTSQGFHVAYLDLLYIVKDAQGNVLIQSSENNIKGLQLNFEAAGLEAYKKAEKKIERELADLIIETIL